MTNTPAGQKLLTASFFFFFIFVFYLRTGKLQKVFTCQTEMKEAKRCGWPGGDERG